MQQMTVSLTAVPWDLVVAYFCVGVWIRPCLRKELATEKGAEGYRSRVDKARIFEDNKLRTRVSGKG